jgi:hypothetical protein
MVKNSRARQSMEAWRIEALAPKLVTQIGCKVHTERAAGGSRWNGDGSNATEVVELQSLQCRAGTQLSQSDIPWRLTGLSLA